MRSNLGNLLLILGTVLSGLAAANSAKASRWLALESGAYPGEFLARAVTADGGDELAAAGAELTDEVVAALRAAGHDGALVKDPPRDVESLARADTDGLSGRILAEDVPVGQESNTIEAGWRVTDALLERLAAAGRTELAIELDGATAAIPTAPAAAPEGLSGDALAAAEAESAETFDFAVADALEGGRVANEFQLTEDVVIAADTFLDDEALAKLSAAPGDDVKVRILKRFTFAGWEMRWVFLLGLGALVAGIFVKRGAVQADAGDEAEGGGAGISELLLDLDTLAQRVEELAGSAAQLDIDEIRGAVDPLLSGELYRLIEHRGVVQAAFGSARFAAIYGPLAGGERFLNRCWSASVDGYPEEARACLGDALPLLQEARTAFREA
ncbi:MAG: hypothetical protein AAF682_22180 [Planctomycetota bacterium]